MAPEEEMVRELARVFDWFVDPLDGYLDSEEDEVSYVFLAVEVTPEVVDAYVQSLEGRGSHELDWEAVLTFLDQALVVEGERVASLVRASFLLQLPSRGAAGYGIVDLLPARLAEAFMEVRPDG